MSKNTVSLTIPPTLVAHIDERVTTNGYGNRSEYIRELVRRDQLAQAPARLRSLIEEGLASGAGRADTQTD